MRLRPTNQTLADALAAQLARADKRVTWCEKELSEMRLLVNGYFSTADALTKTEDERDRLQRENEAMRKEIYRVVELWHDFQGNPAGDIIQINVSDLPKLFY